MNAISGLILSVLASCMLQGTQQGPTPPPRPTYDPSARVEDQVRAFVRYGYKHLPSNLQEEYSNRIATLIAGSSADHATRAAVLPLYLPNVIGLSGEKISMQVDALQERNQEIDAALMMDGYKAEFEFAAIRLEHQLAIPTLSEGERERMAAQCRLLVRAGAECLVTAYGEKARPAVEWYSNYRLEKDLKALTGPLRKLPRLLTEQEMQEALQAISKFAEPRALDTAKFTGVPEDDFRLLDENARAFFTEMFAQYAYPNKHQILPAFKERYYALAAAAAECHERFAKELKEKQFRMLPSSAVPTGRVAPGRGTGGNVPATAPDPGATTSGATGDGPQKDPSGRRITAWAGLALLACLTLAAVSVFWVRRRSVLPS